MKMIHRGEKGFTLIELLVVIAILGVIAAVVALSVAGFFGRGTLQAANTELHQAQTAIIAAMADAETNVIGSLGDGDAWTEWAEEHEEWWAGEEGTVVILGTDGEHYDAADYIYGPFRAGYLVDDTGAIVDGVCYAPDPENPPDGCPSNPWGPTITWGPQDSWINAEDANGGNG